MAGIAPSDVGQLQTTIEKVAVALVRNGVQPDLRQKILKVLVNEAKVEQRNGTGR